MMTHKLREVIKMMSTDVEIKSENEQKTHMIQITPSFVERIPILRIYKENTVVSCASQLAELTCKIAGIENCREAFIRELTQRFDIRLSIEPWCLSIGEDYILPKRVVELLGVAALCRGLSQEVKVLELKQKLNDIEDKAIAFVFDNIPLVEVEEANLVYDAFSRYAYDCLSTCLLNKS